MFVKTHSILSSAFFNISNVGVSSKKIKVSFFSVFKRKTNGFYNNSPLLTYVNSYKPNVTSRYSHCYSGMDSLLNFKQLTQKQGYSLVNFLKWPQRRVPHSWSLRNVV